MHFYNLWRKAVLILHSDSHFTEAGRLQLVTLRLGIQALVVESLANTSFNITPQWLLGFIEGDASFSTNILVPRLQFENTIGDTALLLAIKAFLGVGNMGTSDRKRSNNERPTTILEVNQAGYLANVIIPMFSHLTWYTKKGLDFSDWSIITDLYWHGYHLLPEGSSLILLLKSRMNNYRLSTDPDYNGDLVISPEVFSAVYSLPAPYDTYPAYRMLSGTTNFVSEGLCITTTKESLTLEFGSLTKASKALGIDRTKIKNCILSSTVYKGYTFGIKPY